MLFLAFSKTIFVYLSINWFLLRKLTLCDSLLKTRHWNLHELNEMGMCSNSTTALLALQGCLANWAFTVTVLCICYTSSFWSVLHDEIPNFWVLRVLLGCGMLISFSSQTWHINITAWLESINFSLLLVFIFYLLRLFFYHENQCKSLDTGTTCTH